MEKESADVSLGGACENLGHENEETRAACYYSHEEVPVLGIVRRKDFNFSPCDGQ